MDSSWALAGAIPALIAMWYVDRLDRKRPEPRKTLRKVAIAGAVSVVPCAIIEYFLMQTGPPVGSYARAAYEGFVVAGATEELAKVLCVYWFVWHKPEFDERLDGIVYAARAGLGFALVENVMYLAAQENFSQFAWVFIARALLAVPGHAIWAGMMGYYAARKRFDGVGPGLLGGFLLAVFLHGLYDAAIFASPTLAFDFGAGVGQWALAVPIVIIAGGGFALRRMARTALRADDAAEKRGDVLGKRQDAPGSAPPVQQ